MVVDIPQLQWHRVYDQLPEHPAPLGRLPDLTSRVLIDAQRDEPRQLAPGLSEHAKGRIRRVVRSRLASSTPASARSMFTSSRTFLARLRTAAFPGP